MENCINLKNDSSENFCIKCGHGLDDSWKYCPYCKREISPEQSEKSQHDSNEWLRKILENE